MSTDDARVDFTCTGSAIWRGGYNSGTLDPTDNLYLDIELSTNRISIHFTLSPGTTVTASNMGLKSTQRWLDLAA